MMSSDGDDDNDVSVHDGIDHDFCNHVDDGNIVGTDRGYQGQTMVQIDASEVDMEILRERDDALVKLEVSSSLSSSS